MSSLWCIFDDILMYTVHKFATISLATQTLCVQLVIKFVWMCYVMISLVSSNKVI